jgi:hypothetical protein
MFLRSVWTYSVTNRLHVNGYSLEILKRKIVFSQRYKSWITNTVQGGLLFMFNDGLVIRYNV